MKGETNPRPWLGFNWQLSASSGWGLLGLNLVLQAERDAVYAGVPLAGAANTDWLPPQYRADVETILDRSGVATAQLQGKESGVLDFPVLHSLGNRLTSHDAAERIVGRRNLGIVVFEDTELGSDAPSIAERFDLLLTGSNWNTRVLNKKGFPNVRTLLQGLDLSIFKPVYQPCEDRNPFVIFSGGKLEFRKGQDIVVEAFRRFQERHSEAILLTVWHNHWPESIHGIDSQGYVEGLPGLDSEGYLEVTPWLERNGIPGKALYNLRVTPNYAMPSVYSQADVAVFPNRCEGGTNLVAMECMASGLPTILSANTGHLDLIDEKHCYPLYQQGPVRAVHPIVAGVEGWGESDVEEVLQAFEEVFRDSVEAGKRGREAARFMEGWSLQRFFNELKDYLNEVDVCP